MDQNKTQKPTGLASITSTLNRGSTGDQVKALQQYLVGMGYNNVKPDGIYGPITEAAVKQYQTTHGLSSDGVFGPKSLAKANVMGSTTDTGGTGVPQTQAELDAMYGKAVTSHPEFAGNDQATLDYAAATGDFSGVLNSKGMPFSLAEQQAALKESEQALAPAYNIAKQQETGDVESQLQQTQLDYQKYQDEQATKFQTDKTNLDQNAAEQGVLFSGGRVQKEKMLADSYNKNQAYTQASTGLSIGDIGRGYQTKYGDTATNNLSKYYNLGKNTYNPNVATGGVKQGSLSAMYKPMQIGEYGTVDVANKRAAQQRAGLLLSGKSSKLVGGGLTR
jgi:peptidoglycan hydrolase-like protein with peptidoglycan-binding domain